MRVPEVGLPLPALPTKAEMLLEEVCGIASALWATRGTLPPGLSHGVAGVALLHGYLYLHTGQPEFRDRAEELAGMAVERAAELPLTPLFNGVVGIGWVLEHLRGLEVLPPALVLSSLNNLNK